LNDRLARALGHHQAGRLDEAETLYRELLADQPDHPDALHYLGVIALQGGNGDEAVRLIGRSLELAPANAGALNNLGQACEALDRPVEAEDAYRRALAIVPGDAQANVNLGDLLASRGDFAAVAECLEAALKHVPDDPYLFVNLGTARQACDDLVGALAAFERAAAAQPDFTEAHYNLGRVLQDLDRPGDAVASYERALALQPGYGPALVNLGLAHLDCGRPDDALAFLRRALEGDPENALAHFNLGFALLKQGQLGEGWDEYEWRLQIETRERWGVRDFPQPLWKGENLAGKSLLVWGEQGVGDEILFAGMVPDLAAAGAEVTVDCDKRLMALFERSFDGVRCIGKKNPPLAEALSPDFDFQIPSGSLSRWLRRDFESFPGRASYLAADSLKTSALRDKYGSGNLLIGIAWHSKNKREGLSMREAPNKSMALADLSPLAAIDGLTFVDLQYGDTVTERAAFADQTGVTVIHDADVDQMADLDAFAAQVAAMDLIISISNTTVHFAGALGVPCWVLLNTMPLHCWMRGREDSPWYPSLKLFRQQRDGDWAGVIERVVSELKRFAARERA
jgi:tetratricopeptide (TPR) repeat protein